MWTVYLADEMAGCHKKAAFLFVLAWYLGSLVVPVTAPEPEYQFGDQTVQGIMARFGSFQNAVLALASSAIVGAYTTTSAPSYYGQSATSASQTVSASHTTYSVAFTVPADAQNGKNVLPNIKNSSAVNAQDVCPGYKASGLKENASGFTASLHLAGKPVGQAVHKQEDLY